MNTQGLILAQHLCTGTVLVAFGHPGAGGALLALAAFVFVVGFVAELRRQGVLS